MILAALLALTLPVQVAVPDSTLRISTAVAPETVTVGDPFRSVLRVHATPGSRVEFHGLPVGDTVQPVDTVAGLRGADGEGATALYRAVAWVAGGPIAAAVEVRVMEPGRDPRSYRVPLRLPVVRSVLPADTAGLRPKPARAPLPFPVSRPLWPWLAGSAMLLVLGLVAWRAFMRRPAPARPREHPRDAALRALDALSGEGLSPRRTVDRASEILRRYLEATEPDWREAWTDSELLARIDPAAMAAPDRTALSRLLADAGAMKFTGARVSATEAEGFRASVRQWVAAYGAAAAVAEREAA